MKRMQGGAMGLVLATLCVLGLVIAGREWLQQREAARAAEERRIAAQLARQLEQQAADAAAAREAAKPPEQRERERREETERQAKAAAAQAQRQELLAQAATLRPKVDALAWYDACVRWGRLARQPQHTAEREALLQRLLELRAINGTDLAHVTDRLPAIGMTACGVYAQLGMPDDINTTETAHGTSQQLVYRSPTRYVYVDGERGNANGTVRSVQH